MSQFFQTAQGRTPLQAGAQLLVWSATGLFVAPIAGRLAGRHGNQPFMLAGLLMQTAGLACLAVIARRHTPSLEMAPLLTVAGFRSALWVAVAFSAIGILLALTVKRVPAPKPEPAVVSAGPPITDQAARNGG